MKLLIASDLHGSEYYTQQLFAAWDREGASRLLLLGDLLYHGARNALPREYGTMSVAELLNSRRDRLFALAGNCDSAVDQKVLDFSIQAPHCFLYLGETIIFATHGHIYNPERPPLLPTGSFLLTGHTHVPDCRPCGNGLTYINPGSVSIPKNNSPHSYLLLDGETLRWKELGGKQFMEYAIVTKE